MQNRASPSLLRKSAKPLPSKGKTDACILPTSAEIEAVQGELIKAIERNTQRRGGSGFRMPLPHNQVYKISQRSIGDALFDQALSTHTAQILAETFHTPDMEADEIRAAGKRAQKPEPEGKEEDASRAGLRCPVRKGTGGLRSRARSISCKETSSSALASVAFAKNRYESRKRRRS